MEGKLIGGETTATLTNGFQELAIGKMERKSRAQAWIKTMSREQRDPIYKDGESTRWGTDGSARPSTAKWGEKRTVVSAVVGPRGLRTASSILSHTIFQAEATAIAYQTELMEKGDNHTVYSDHLNSLRLISDLTNSSTSSHKLRKMPGRSIYKWIWSNIKETGGDVSFQHFQSHTNGTDIGSQINERADREASLNTGRDRDLMPQTIIPTWVLDDYAIFSEEWGWIETSVSEFVQNKPAKMVAKEMDEDIKFKTRMSTSLYDSRPHPAPVLPISKGTRRLCGNGLAVRQVTSMAPPGPVKRGGNELCKVH